MRKLSWCFLFSLLHIAKKINTFKSTEHQKILLFFYHQAHIHLNKNAIILAGSHLFYSTEQGASCNSCQAHIWALADLSVGCQALCICHTLTCDLQKLPLGACLAQLVSLVPLESPACSPCELHGSWKGCDCWMHSGCNVMTVLEEEQLFSLLWGAQQH